MFSPSNNVMKHRPQADQVKSMKHGYGERMEHESKLIRTHEADRSESQMTFIDFDNLVRIIGDFDNRVKHH